MIAIPMEIDRDRSGTLEATAVVSATAIGCWLVIHVATGGWPMGAFFAAATTVLLLGVATRAGDYALAAGAVVALLGLVAIGSRADLQFPTALLVGVIVAGALFGGGYVLTDRLDSSESN